MPSVSCLTCHKVIATATGLLSHCVARGHQMRQDLPACQQCGIVFNSIGERDRHSLKKHKALASSASGQTQVANPSTYLDGSDANVVKVPPSFDCAECGARFEAQNGLRGHMQMARHDWCKFCTVVIPSHENLRQHMLRKHAQCSECRRPFRLITGLLSHCETQRHVSAICRPCKRSFLGFQDLEQHLNSDDHFSVTAGKLEADYSCATCNRPYTTEKGLIKHLKKSPRHHWCGGCKQDFLTSEQKSQHDCPAKGHFACFFCDRVFQQTSALAHHLEAGVHNINRHQITAAVYAMNVIPDITTRMIEDRPRELPPPLLETFRVDESSWNGSAYACHLCPKTFNHRGKLNSHLNSAAHDAKQFRCPKAECRRLFSLVSAFIQHIESECCGLTEAKEITDRFMHLSGQFTRALTS